MTEPEQLMSAKTVANLIEVNEATIWRWVNDEKFPKPIQMGQRATRWRASEVAAWQAAKMAEGDAS